MLNAVKRLTEDETRKSRRLMNEINEVYHALYSRLDDDTLTNLNHMLSAAHTLHLWSKRCDESITKLLDELDQ